MSSKYQTQLAQFARRALSATKPQSSETASDEINLQRLKERMGVTELPPPVERKGNVVTINAYFDPKKREKP